MMRLDWKAWFLSVWEDNRRLTNKVARALAEVDALDARPVPGMRPFRDMLLEIWEMERAYIRGLADGEWTWEGPPEALKTATADELLAYGDEVRARTRAAWDRISMESLLEVRPDPFWEGPETNAVSWLTYALENEIHHRGQGYVYLRLLGHEPPAFYDRT
jgi:uncharacterized damage-inducible protein DinB